LPYLAALIIVTFVTGLYIIVRYAPKDTPNKPVTDPIKIRKYKKLSLAYLFIWFIAVIVLAIFKLNLYILSLCFGILLELFTISPTGHRFFDIVKGNMSGKRKRHS
jgi:accessory gene regulator B